MFAAVDLQRTEVVRFIDRNMQRQLRLTILVIGMALAKERNKGGHRRAISSRMTERIGKEVTDRRQIFCSVGKLFINIFDRYNCNTDGTCCLTAATALLCKAFALLFIGIRNNDDHLGAILTNTTAERRYIR